TLSDSEEVTVTVKEVNVAPVLDPIGNKSVDEEQTLSFTATASDHDVPAQTLSFSLEGTVPLGASITSGGAFSWPPTASQGGHTYTFSVPARRTSNPTLSDSEEVTVTVKEVNVAPVLDPIGNKSVDEEQTLSFTATASDHDVPAQTLSFSLEGTVPLGASITS